MFLLFFDPALTLDELDLCSHQPFEMTAVFARRNVSLQMSFPLHMNHDQTGFHHYLGY